MGIPSKPKSKRVPRVRRLTPTTLPSQPAVAPAVLPEGAKCSQEFGPDMATAKSELDSALPTGSDDQTLSVIMSKVGDETHVTLVGDVKHHMGEFGTKDLDFLNGLVDQVGNASPKSSRYLEEIGLDSWGVKQFADEVGIKQMLAFIRECKPRDPIEATLFAQMAAINAAAMSFANRLANAETLTERDSAERTLNKLMRTYAVQVQTLQRYRSKFENNIFVQNVSVNDAAQAIVGDVNRPMFEGPSKEQTRAMPLIADARQEPLEIIGEQRPTRVPLQRK